ncbi:MAG TPA: RodZ domain-containing protein [Blastocatellia bacterium]|nr:RodZ domain-containing protein [Blastocatellia bacterium]
MPTLGEELRRRREERGISLTDISEATKIGTRFLKAIETDKFSVLPGGIFTRSFIRAYAKHIGMSEDEAIALYQRQVTQEAEPPVDVEAPRRPPPATELHSRRPPPVSMRQMSSKPVWPTIVISAGILLFIVIIVLGLVKVFDRSSASQQAKSTPTAEPEHPAVKTTPAQPPPSSAPDTIAQAQTIAGGSGLAIQLEATDGDSWVRYQIDDAKPEAMMLRQGQTQSLPPAQNQVKLNIGNRQTLKVKINNREATFPPDTPNFKAQLVISRDNLRTYFP